MLRCIFCVLSAMFAAVLVLTLTGCDMMDGTKDEPYKPTFRFGDQVYIKDGFYQGYGCVVTDEGSNGVYCRINVIHVEDKDEEVLEEYREKLHLRVRDVQKEPISYKE